MAMIHAYRKTLTAVLMATSLGIAAVSATTSAEAGPRHGGGHGGGFHGGGFHGGGFHGGHGGWRGGGGHWHGGYGGGYYGGYGYGCNPLVVVTGGCW
jgi:uncharacterized membrane protein